MNQIITSLEVKEDLFLEVQLLWWERIRKVMLFWSLMTRESYGEMKPFNSWVISTRSSFRRLRGQLRIIVREGESMIFISNRYYQLNQKLGSSILTQYLLHMKLTMVQSLEYLVLSIFVIYLALVQWMVRLESMMP